MLPHEVEPGWLTYDGHVAAYQAARDALTLELPEGARLPAMPPPETEPGTLYQSGTGEVAALFAWLYLVERAAVDAHARGDLDEAHRWVTVAAQFVETDTFAKFNDPDVPISWYDHVIAPALRGDFTNLAQDADFNAPRHTS